MLSELQNDYHAVGQAAGLLFRRLTAPRPPRTPRAPLPGPAHHLLSTNHSDTCLSSPLKSPSAATPAAWRLGFWKLGCGHMSAPLGHLYDRDATVNACFATVRFHFPAHPQKPDPAHTGLRAWGVQWTCSPEVHPPRSARPWSLPDFQDCRQGAWLGQAAAGVAEARLRAQAALGPRLGAPLT